ncbi:Peptidase family S41 [Chitinophaga rupis]|uniref:Peptidase family S41 n=1 Tax=Chitinophaga rupis TaxID=573321 RepID=A0A1H8E7V9_9BACT|nr:S41 family peptidase [Chitinophaga rupis]SEN14868.1 Peptidase family S41 [Chitinophaga rupis]
MKVKLIILFAVFTLPFLASGQGSACDCLANLNETIKKTEENYAGFPAKENAGYHKLVGALQSKAASEKDAKRCFYLIRDYVRFFKDKHFSFTYVNADDSDLEMVEDDAISGKPDAVEGMWVNPDSTVWLRIKKFPGNEYKAIIVKAKDEKLKKGLVYFSLTPHKKGFLLKQYNVFNSVDMYAKQRGGLLQLWNFALYGKVGPTAMTTAEKAELNKWRDNNNGLDFQMPDKETALVKIPTFFNNDSKIEKLIAAHDKEIRNSKYLVIDLRGNGGGNSGWSFLLPYVMTNPIKQDVPLLRVSPDNVKLKRGELEYFVKNPVPAEAKKYFPDPFIAQLKKAYEELPVTKNAFYAIPGLTIPVDSILQHPSKVALITDDLCGSSAEYFFKLMAQSSKTVRYGINSVGMMDYEGPGTTTPLPHKQFILMIPVSKSSWTDENPIDDTGFTPDVKLTIPEEEWVKYVLKDLKERS